MIGAGVLDSLLIFVLMPIVITVLVVAAIAIKKSTKRKVIKEKEPRLVKQRPKKPVKTQTLKATKDLELNEASRLIVSDVDTRKLKQKIKKISIVDDVPKGKKSKEKKKELRAQLQLFSAKKAEADFIKNQAKHEEWLKQRNIKKMEQAEVKQAVEALMNQIKVDHSTKERIEAVDEEDFLSIQHTEDSKQKEEFNQYKGKEKEASERRDPVNILDFRFFRNTLSEVAKTAIFTHAIDLINFQYDDRYHAHSLYSHIKTLGFIYHLHRYNLGYRIIAQQVGAPVAVHLMDLRTCLVHSGNRLFLENTLTDTIAHTRTQLQQFLPQDIFRLIYQKNNFINKKDELALRQLESMCGVTVYDHQEYNIFTTPFFYMLTRWDPTTSYCIQNALHIDAFKVWIGRDVTTFLNTLGSLLPDASHELKKDILDAIKMFAIIIGEYCNHVRIENLSLDHQPENDDLLCFMRFCKLELRNLLCHDIYEISDDKINTFLTLANSVNAFLPEFQGLETVISMDYLLNPEIDDMLILEAQHSPSPERRID